jgi:hypothetical protein
VGLLLTRRGRKRYSSMRALHLLDKARSSYNSAAKLKGELWGNCFPHDDHSLVLESVAWEKG